MELSPALRPQQGLSRDFCSPWGQLVSRLSGGESGDVSRLLANIYRRFHVKQIRNGVKVMQ